MYNISQLLKMEKIELCLEENNLKKSIIALRYLYHKTITSVFNILRSKDKKELNNYLYSLNIYMEDFADNNFIPHISKIDYITEKGMKIHFLTHITLYFLAKKGICSLDQERFEKSNDKILNILLSNDKMGFVYDLYIMYIYGIKFHSNIFNQKFLLENKGMINKIIDDIYVDLFQEGNDDLNVKSIVNNNIDNISGNDEKEFFYLEQVSDLFGLLDLGFKGNFEISSRFYKKMILGGDVIGQEELPVYIIPIIYKIFGDKKTIEINEANYLEYKEKFKIARIEYLDNLGLNEESTKKEIRAKINKKVEQLSRINTLRIRDPEKEGYENKKVKEFKRKITLLSKIIKK